MLWAASDSHGSSSENSHGSSSGDSHGSGHVATEGDGYVTHEDGHKFYDLAHLDGHADWDIMAEISNVIVDATVIVYVCFFASILIGICV